MPQRVAIIGWGAIGQVVAAGLIESCETPLTALLVRPHQVPDVAASVPPDTRVVTAVVDLLAENPDVVIECAGQNAVREYGKAVLSSGADMMIASTGALADEALLKALRSAASASNAQILIPAGAIAGLDGLGALRAAGLTSVIYTSSKPPRAWIGTEAEKLLDLGALRERTLFFAGSAREAALKYPKNANVAATIALAGLGLDETTVRLVADPEASGNTGMIEASSKIGDMKVVMANAASANPKTSANTAFSLLHALRTRTATLAI